MFVSSNAFRFALVLAAAFNAVTSAEHVATPSPTLPPSTSAAPSESAAPTSKPSTSAAPSTSFAPSLAPTVDGYSDAVNLGAAGNYVILAKSGISTVPNSHITGDIAVSPIAATAITGFSLTADATNEFSTTTQVTGQVKASNYAVPTPSDLTTAVSNMETAYTDAAGRLITDGAKLNLGSGLLGTPFGNHDNPLTAGVYTFNTDVTIGADLYFDGTDTDVFIIQMTGDLVQIKNTQVILENGVLAKNIFWQIAGHVLVHTDAHLQGILLVQTDVTFETHSSLYGRVLAQTACVLDQATMTEPAE
jgi:hypothetical protein